MSGRGEPREQKGQSAARGEMVAAGTTRADEGGGRQERDRSPPSPVPRRAPPSHAGGGELLTSELVLPDVGSVHQ